MTLTPASGLVAGLMWVYAGSRNATRVLVPRRHFNRHTALFAAIAGLGMSHGESVCHSTTETMPAAGWHRRWRALLRPAAAGAGDPARCGADGPAAGRTTGRRTGCGDGTQDRRALSAEFALAAIDGAADLSDPVNSALPNNTAITSTPRAAGSWTPPSVAGVPAIRRGVRRSIRPDAW